ncbi:MAG: FtsH protease activity modulator HflK [Sneathiella sp.]|jgi:membrane protease subunit HflK|uniref:FtsH protease activity modulator HflK n=1 Tax=Sneathiella sp. TaxID=1964365 RepID=UPI000C52E3D5|nr:FtsH protease activity modulator HflK [Sneathiella sp.]MAL78144.1 FtsH protease activity modulator HflK [Sneathiella sp.]
MPWSNQGGNDGGWQGGGGNRGPWGQGPSGQQPPNLEDIIKKGQERLKDVIPGGGGGKLGIMILLLVLLVAWLISGFYKVETTQQGVVLRFGKWVNTTQPGLNYHLPYPIETVLTPEVTKVNSLEVGFRPTRGGGSTAVEAESLMLTGDENIVDIGFTVLWRIKDAGLFLFNVEQPELAIKNVAESAMREVIGRTNLTAAITEGRLLVETEVLKRLQEILDGYGAGVQVLQVQLKNAEPPAQVIAAFRDVQAAEADKERAQNEALAYANDIIPRARGEAERIRQEAEGYKQQVIAEAEGEAARFLSIYEEYAKAPYVTRQRIYLETLQEVFSGKNKIIIDGGSSGTSGVVPYLPLNELQKGGASK